MLIACTNAAWKQAAFFVLEHRGRGVWSRVKKLLQHVASPALCVMRPLFAKKYSNIACTVFIPCIIRAPKNARVAELVYAQD